MSLYIRIKKRLGDFTLDSSFRSDGDRLALLGSSGSGKSVTLRCIAGIMTPDEGYIELDGRVLFDSEKKVNLTPQNRRVGYLFQQYALFPNMTVGQNVKVAVRDKSKREETAARLLRVFQLENELSKRPSQLSGGQQQRLALARILASDPKLLLLDEPFSALDSFLKAHLEQELADMLESFPGDVIWVTHDRDEVFHNCNKICIVDGGKTQPVITPELLFYAPSTVSAAKLSGCKNIVAVVPNGNRISVPCWSLSLFCGKAIPEHIAFAGLRAHHILFASDGDDNAFKCKIVRIMDNVFSYIFTLRPIGSSDSAPLLRLETPKDMASPVKGENVIVTVKIAPENILLLR